jgi:hypothetical protein
LDDFPALRFWHSFGRGHRATSSAQLPEYARIGLILEFASAPACGARVQTHRSGTITETVLSMTFCTTLAYDALTHGNAVWR